MIKGVHVGRNGLVEVREIKGGLKSLYEVTNCDCIDIAVRFVNGKPFDFVCDDEGLFKENQFVSVFSKTHGIEIVGDVFICTHDGGDLRSLSDKDIAHILGSVEHGMVMTD